MEKSFTQQPVYPSLSSELKHYWGKFRGIIVDNYDPEMRGRIRADVPCFAGLEQKWALPCLPYTRESYLIPPIGTNVWIEFENGNLDWPIWTGCYWLMDRQQSIRFEPVET